MADDTDVSVRFGADTGPLQAGAEQASEAVADFGAQVASISEAIRAQTEAMQEGFATLAESMREDMEEVVEAEERAEAGMMGLLSSVKEGAEQLTEMREAAMGFGEAMLAVFAFDELKEFVESLGEAGERVQHTAQAFGMTTAQVQQFQGVFTAAGAGPDALQMSMMRLDRAASAAVSGQARAADAFKQLGVNLDEAHTPAALLEETLQGFSNIPAPDRVAVAMAVFGRNIQEIAPLLGMTKEQLEEFEEQVQRTGAVNEEAVGKMAALGGALNETKNAGTGLQNVMGDALAGAFQGIVGDINGLIEAFTQSYNSGGMVRSIMQALASIIALVGEVFEQIGSIIVSAWEAITGQTKAVSVAFDAVRLVATGVAGAVAIFGATVRSVFDSVGALINQAEVAWTTLGHVIVDALTGNWGQITADMKQGADQIVAIAHDAAQRIKGEWQNVGADTMKVWNGGQRPGEESPTATAGKPPKLGGDKKPKDDMVSEWQEQLRQIDDLQQNWYADQNALAVKFWQGIVASGAGSAKDQQQAQDALAEALKALDNEEVTSAVEAAQKKVEAAKGNVDQVRQIYADLEQMLIARHAQGGQEWTKVEQQKVEAVRKAIADMNAAETQRIARAGAQTVKDDQSQGKATDTGLSTQEDVVKANAASGVITKQQEAAQLAAIDQQIEANDLATNQRVLNDTLDTLNREIAANQDNADKIKGFQQQITDAKQEAADRQAQIVAQGTQREVQAQLQATQQIQQAWNRGIGSTVSTFTSGMLNMGEHGASFESVMLNVGNSIAGNFMQAIDKMITNWIMQMGVAAGLIPAQTAATNVPQIISAAGVAAANTFASTAAIPIVGPEMAPGAAAAAYAEVMSFSVASAAGGYDIPAGVNPLTQLHENEMVLPSSIAEPLRGMIAANGNSPDLGGSGARGGDTYNTSVYGLDSRSMRRMMNNPGNVRAAAGAFAKHG